MEEVALVSGDNSQVSGDNGLLLLPVELTFLRCLLSEPPQKAHV